MHAVRLHELRWYRVKTSLEEDVFLLKEETSMDYKDTLLMPKTAFEMLGKLPTKEPNMQKRCKEGKLYEKMLEKRK